MAKAKIVKRVRPAGSPPKGHKVTVRRQKVDTSQIGKPIDRIKNGQVNPNRVGLGHGHHEIPYDMPVDVELFRVMGDAFTNHKGEAIDGLLGHVFECKWWTKGAKGERVTVTMKSFQEPNGIVVEVNGKQVFKWVQNNEDLPTHFNTFLAEAREVGSRFIAANNLQPGDEVIEGADGVIDIIRADDELADEEEDIEWL